MSAMVSQVSVAPGGLTPDLARAFRRIATAWVVTLYSNAAIYLNLFLLPAIPALYWILLLCGASGAAFLRRGSITRDVRLAFPAALATYGAMCLIWYIAHGGGDPEILRKRLLGLSVSLAAYAVFSSDPTVLWRARRAALYAVLVAVAINIYDITHPFALIPADSEFAVLGRAAGLYVNPNQSAAAIVLGYLLTIDTVSRRWRAVYTVWVAIGVVLTVSRAAIAEFVLCLATLSLISKSLRARDAVVAMGLGAVLALFGWVAIVYGVAARLQISPELAFDRLLGVFGPSGPSDFSQQERTMLAERGWAQFVASPLIGNGIGSTELWSLRTSTHNFYLMMMSDFGIAGACVLPVLLLTAIRGRWLAANGGIASGFVLIWALFSHNILSEYFMLIGLAMIAAAGALGDHRALSDELGTVTVVPNAEGPAPRE